MLASAAGADVAKLQLASRIVVELLYATVEMLFDAMTVAWTVAVMIASHLGKTRPVEVEEPRPARKKVGRQGT